MSTDTTGPRPFVIARVDNIGDVLLTGPAVRAVAASGHPVVFVCSPQGEAAARLLPGVTSTIVFRTPWIDAAPPPVDAAALDAFVARLAVLGAAGAAILCSSHQSPLPMALVLRLAGIAPIAAVSHDYGGSLLDERIPGDPQLHEVERNLAVVARLGYRLPPGDDGVPHIEVPPAVSPADPFVLVHPGASVPARTLAPDRWAALCRLLVAAGLRVVLTGSDEERSLVDAVATEAPGTVDVSGRTDLAELAQLLAAAAAVAVGNTGVAHLAAAVGTPIVSIFPPTVDPARWVPRAPTTSVFGQLDIGCRDCRSRICPFPEQPCLAVLDVRQVAAAMAAHVIAPAVAITSPREPIGAR